MTMDIGIPDPARKDVALGLCRLLADSYALYLKIHGFHWNVTGPSFQTLHLMFMGQYTELWNALDVIAERIRSLGEFAPGSYTTLRSFTSIPDSEGVPDAQSMLREVLAGHEAVIRTARSILPLAERAGDQVSADVLTQRLNVHEKTAWMLRSMLG
ncbi:MAG TPA: Dps family protein [Myxococcota bacterium]|nr:Dps family protein [Myxococcota bacterium]HNH46882.1 Dps family protein [Myxococcota bacterium]